MDTEFHEKCLSQRTIIQPPSVVLITDKKEKQLLADQHNRSAVYFLEAASNILGSSTPLAAIILAYFAMEHKANQLLALHGYKVESHYCTQMALSRVAQRKDLAKQLSEMFTLRQNIGYRLNLIQNAENRKEAETTIQRIIIHFIPEIDRLITASDNKNDSRTP